MYSVGAQEVSGGRCHGEEMIKFLSSPCTLPRTCHLYSFLGVVFYFSLEPSVAPNMLQQPYEGTGPRHSPSLLSQSILSSAGSPLPTVLTAYNPYLFLPSAPGPEVNWVHVPGYSQLQGVLPDKRKQKRETEKYLYEVHSLWESERSKQDCGRDKIILTRRQRD